MKTNILRVVSLATLAVAGCGNQAGAGTPAPAQDETKGATASQASEDAASTDIELAVLDRKQAHYLTTSLRSSDGARLTEGLVRLDILSRKGGAYITLDVTGYRDDGQPWRGNFQVAESQLLGSDADLARAPARLVRAEHRIAGHLQGERSINARLAIAREAAPKMKPALHGHVLFDDGASADFRSEYEVHCLVPVGTLGQAMDVQQDPESHAQLSIEDSRFESAFCRKFAALR